VRTHLMRTFYPTPTSEPDTGCAANEACATAEPERSVTPLTNLRVAPVAKGAESPANDEHEDYYLGGYAGI